MTVSRALVYGLAVAGESTVRALLRRGVEVVVADDDVDDRRSALAAELGVELLDRPDADTLAEVISGCELVSPAPGVPETHAVVSAARDAGVELVSEIELAHRWEQDRPGGPRPMLAITGTDGKTTTTLLAVEMLRAAGLRTIDAGNTSTPLVDAIEMDLDAFVVECTSFRLAWTPTFRAEGAAWLNLAPDHLNWHRSMSSYEAAKAQVWAHQRPDDVAVGFVDDPVVMRRLREAPGRKVTFGAAGADYHVDTRGEERRLVGPAGTIRARVRDEAQLAARPDERIWPRRRSSSRPGSPMRRRSPRRSPRSPGHRTASNMSARGTTSPGTTTPRPPHPTPPQRPCGPSSTWCSSPAATTRASIWPQWPPTPPASRRSSRPATRPIASWLRSRGVAVVEVVADLDEAVERASQLARPGATVLLSPGCASFDRYSGFEARGDHFRSLVLDRFAPSATGIQREGSR